MVIEKREGKCCDAVVRQIERATGATRTAVSDPECTGKGPPVDLRVTLGEREYALEHTRVLPFGDRIEVAKAYQDIRGCLPRWFPEPLPGDAFYELHLPVEVSRPGLGRRGERRRKGLHDWIESAVDVLQARAPSRRRPPPHVYEFDHVRGCPESWECEFALARSNDGVVSPRSAGALAVVIGSPDDPEPPFVEELRRAFRDKCPKLADCKGLAPNLLTVLILEAVDLPFLHDLYIANHLARLLEGGAPDQISLVYPHDTFDWQVWVVKSDDVRWPDERLPMPHRGYQTPPAPVPAEAYPPGFAEQMNRGWGREIPLRWQPLFVAGGDLDDIKQCGAPLMR